MTYNVFGGTSSLTQSIFAIVLSYILFIFFAMSLLLQTVIATVDGKSLRPHVSRPPDFAGEKLPKIFQLICRIYINIQPEVN